MFLLRGLFWLGLVAYLAPYKMIDSSHANILIDEQAIGAGLAALPRYCEDHHRVCAAALDLGHALCAQGEATIATAFAMASQLR